MQLRTQLGKRIEGWSASSQTQLRTDLDSVTKVPIPVLRSVVEKVVKIYPACNVIELAALEAERSSLPDSEIFLAAISSFTYIWENIYPSESPASVAEDLIALGVLSGGAATVLKDLLKAAEPFREAAKVASDYIRVGSPLFVGIRGTVDIRLRFHKTADEFAAGNLPSALVGSQQVIMANLTINQPDGEEAVVSFLMDENDLNYMKRFVRNMERELELSKGLLSRAEK